MLKGIPQRYQVTLELDLPARPSDPQEVSSLFLIQRLREVEESDPDNYDDYWLAGHVVRVVVEHAMSYKKDGVGLLDPKTHQVLVPELPDTLLGVEKMEPADFPDIDDYCIDPMQVRRVMQATWDRWREAGILQHYGFSERQQRLTTEEQEAQQLSAEAYQIWRKKNQPHDPAS